MPYPTSEPTPRMPRHVFFHRPPSVPLPPWEVFQSIHDAYGPDALLTGGARWQLARREASQGDIDVLLPEDHFVFKGAPFEGGGSGSGSGSGGGVPAGEFDLIAVPGWRSGEPGYLPVAAVLARFDLPELAVAAGLKWGIMWAADQRMRPATHSRVLKYAQRGMDLTGAITLPDDTPRRQRLGLDLLLGRIEVSLACGTKLVRAAQEPPNPTVMAVRP